MLPHIGTKISVVILQKRQQIQRIIKELANGNTVMEQTTTHIWELKSSQQEILNWPKMKREKSFLWNSNVSMQISIRQH